MPPSVGYAVPGGRSILGMLEGELTEAYRLAMRKRVKNRHIARGRVFGLALAVATVRAPYKPDPAGVLAEVKAHYRWAKKGKVKDGWARM